MAKWQNAVVTSAGISMLGQVMAGGELNIIRAALGGGTVDASALMTQTALTLPLDVPAVIAKKKLIDGSGISIRVQIRNTGVSATQTMKQVGLFAKIGDGDEALFAIMQDDVGEEIPSASSYPDFMLEFTAAVAVSNTDGIIVTFSGSAVVTWDDLEEELSGYATTGAVAAVSQAVQELSTSKADKSDIPTKLPANGGIADNAMTANHQVDHVLAAATNVLAYAVSASCRVSANTKVRIFNSPTCPTNYGYSATDSDFIYDIFKIDDNSWVTIKAYDVRSNKEFINSCADGTWTGWVRCNDGGDAATLESHPASDFALKSDFNSHTLDNTVHASAAEKALWNTASDNLAVHAANNAIHVTSDEKAFWNKFPNENLFDNPDFSINQRGDSQYTTMEKVGADRWTLQGSGKSIKMEVLSGGGVKVTNAGPNAGIKQFYPADEITAGETYTISADIDGVRHAVAIVAATDNSGVAAYPETAIYAAIIYDSAGKKWAVFPYVTYTAGQSAVVKDVKFELGNRATRFVKPIPAVELLKCQRYYQICSTNSIDPIDLRPTMRTTPKDITKVEGGYAYVAEY